MTDEQIARLPQVLDRMNRLHIMKHPVQDYYDLDAAAREYLRLLPHIKAVCSAVDKENAAIRNYIQTTEHERHRANNAVHAAADALVSAVKEGEE